MIQVDVAAPFTTWVAWETARFLVGALLVTAFAVASVPLTQGEEPRVRRPQPRPRSRGTRRASR